MARTTPAWERLVREGWFQSREEAHRWILSGKVRAGNVPITTAGQRIPNDAPLFVRNSNLRYVSKGGLKLAGAIEAFGIDISGKVCLDAGASTGGFCDCLLVHGAARVYAVDVGYGQLAGSLRANPAVVNLERTNIGDACLLDLQPRPILGTVDLSYLSLRKAVPQFAGILHGAGELICLVKPLFELDDAAVRRSGIMPPDAYEPLLYSLADAFTNDGYAVLGITHSPVTGNSGTLEFFMHLSLHGREGLDASACRQAAHASVAAAQALPPYSKPSIRKTDTKETDP